MWTRQKKRTHRSRLVLPVLTLLCLGYFGFHAFHGSFGIYSSEQLELQKKTLTDRLAKLTHERQSLERQVALLEDGTVERDMLDEQARRSLNFSKSNDLTILQSFKGE